MSCGDGTPSFFYRFGRCVVCNWRYGERHSSTAPICCRCVVTGRRFHHAQASTGMEVRRSLRVSMYICRMMDRQVRLRMQLYICMIALDLALRFRPLSCLLLCLSLGFDFRLLLLLTFLLQLGHPQDDRRAPRPEGEAPRELQGKDRRRLPGGFPHRQGAGKSKRGHSASHEVGPHFFSRFGWLFFVTRPGTHVAKAPQWCGSGEGLVPVPKHQISQEPPLAGRSARKFGEKFPDTSSKFRVDFAPTTT